VGGSQREKEKQQPEEDEYFEPTGEWKKERKRNIGNHGGPGEGRKEKEATLKDATHPDGGKKGEKTSRSLFSVITASSLSIREKGQKKNPGRGKGGGGKRGKSTELPHCSGWERRSVLLAKEKTKVNPSCLKGERKRGKKRNSILCFEKRRTRRLAGGKGGVPIT